jgi:hypothetical protein
MTETRKRVAFVCERCGSSDVVSDARATWDVRQQEWTLVGHYDASECLACERETNLIVVELAPEPQA